MATSGLKKNIIGKKLEGKYNLNQHDKKKIGLIATFQFLRKVIVIQVRINFKNF